MAQLFLKSNMKLLSNRLEIADSLYTRMKGLLGRKSLENDEMIWIHRCNSIHTFFMNFPIDCIFLDKDLRIKKVFSDVNPWRITLPVLSASSVIELSGGQARILNLKAGDQLYVCN